MKKTDFKNIQLLVLDVDGVLTNGAIVINSDGSETKFFNSLDGHGIKMWQRAGLKVAILSGRFSEPTEQRAKQLGIENCIQGCLDKIEGLEKLLEELKLSAEQVAYIGDDLPDLPAIKYVGFGATVANAVDEVKQHADYVTKNNGGSGAVREVIELVLKSTGQWQQLLKKYLPE